MTSDKPAQKKQTPMSGAIFLALLGLAHVPMLFAYFRQLWIRDHYQFFPFAILTFVVLYRSRCEVPLRRWSVWCTLLVVLDCALLGAAVYLKSTFLAIAAAGCLVSAVAIATPDRRTRLSLAYLIPLFVLVVRPPLGLDERLVNRMQTSTTTVASHVLDQMGYVHHRAGNVIQLPNKDLLLEEACSGVQSLFTILFIGVFVSVYHRRSGLHLFVLAGLSAAWAFGFNVLRIVSIAVAWDHWQFDLATGTAHTVLGYTFLLAAIGMLFSTDGLARLFIAPIEQAPGNAIDEHHGYASDYDDDAYAADGSRGLSNIFIDLWNGLTQPWAVPINKRFHGLLRWNPRMPTPVWMIPGLIAAIGLCAIQIPQVLGQTARRGTPPSDPSVFTSEDVPDTLGRFRLVDYRIDQRDQLSNFGEFSNVWQFAREDGTSVHVSCDHAFYAWHDLEVCYTGLGWEVETRQVVGGRTDWPSIEVAFSKPTGERAWLVYGFFSAAGERIVPGQGSLSASFVDRFRKTQATEAVQLYQVQLFAEAPERLTEAVRKELLQVHRDSREAIRSGFLGRREGEIPNE